MLACDIIILIFDIETNLRVKKLTNCFKKIVVNMFPNEEPGRHKAKYFMSRKSLNDENVPAFPSPRRQAAKNFKKNVFVDMEKKFYDI